MILQLYLGARSNGLFADSNLLVMGAFTIVAMIVCVGASNIINFMDGCLTICHRIMLHENRRTKQEQRAKSLLHYALQGGGRPTGQLWARRIVSTPTS